MPDDILTELQQGAPHPRTQRLFGAAAEEIFKLREALNIAHKWMGSRQPIDGDDILAAAWRREMKMIEDALGPHRTADTLAGR